MIKIIVGVSMAYNFRTGNNKILLLTEHESVTQKVSVPGESVLQEARQLLVCTPFVTGKMFYGIHFPSKFSLRFNTSNIF